MKDLGGDMNFNPLFAIASMNVPLVAMLEHFESITTYLCIVLATMFVGLWVSKRS